MLKKIKPSRWTEELSLEDLTFLKRFVLASGSLKDTARVYGISYPTVRIRLDRLIAKIEVLDSLATESPFERLVRGLYAEGRLDLEVMRELLSVHERELGGREE